MAQQTAVEWLLKQINKQSYSLGDINITINVPKDIIEQAKQMEKEQIVEAFDCDGSPQPGEKWISNGEQYYNETYSQ